MILAVPQVDSETQLQMGLALGIKEADYKKHVQHAQVLSLRKNISFNLTWSLPTMAMTSVERSEHCCYPHSRAYISRLVRAGGSKYPSVHGAESGGFELPDGNVVLFKMESHNHPSEKEGFQGAATGIGGIVRDVLAMGIRPLALLDPLYFGPKESKHAQYTCAAVIAGISWYGNCLGLPNLGGQLSMDLGHYRKTLVNVMCAGVGRKEHLVSAAAVGSGNKVLIVGNDTGPDGIGGASILASARYEEGKESRSEIQVGDPFTEKKLVEAFLECVYIGLIEACKDMGAAGLTCTTTEMCEAGGLGMRIDLAKVPLRVTEMHASDVLMSESQERMLVIVTPENTGRVIEIFEKWDLHASVIGEVRDDPLLYVYNKEELIAVADPSYMVRGPIIPLQPERPSRIEEVWKPPVLREPKDLGRVLLRLLSSPKIGSKRAVFRQYDRTVMTNTVIEAGSADAGVIRVKGSPYGLAFTTDCNPVYCFLDPERGAEIAVAEAARNLSCVGANPVALTDCLNFGDPDDPTVAWQFEETIKGLVRAMDALRVRCISGNVSFYNQDDQGPVYPTPTIGMCGVLKDVTRTCTASFKREGDQLFLVGPIGMEELGGSEYVRVLKAKPKGRPPKVNLSVEEKVQSLVRKAIELGILSSAHDCSDGGIAVTLAESCIMGELGATVTLPRTTLGSLFGEDQSRIVVSLTDPKRFVRMAKNRGVPIMPIGVVGGKELVIEDGNGNRVVRKKVGDLEEAWNSAFKNFIG